ncbi:MAG TPA: sigma-70 family RNA polymerase sigma factor [Saprospiraceae bacterium]|nr:sigma-70 family RNA polymerase sigma factor [Saprospiraceae bacterium]HMQ81574.1 sigma-70 family RNA polymerase sigma factor [Saprospiraceae bacterium]
MEKSDQALIDAILKGGQARQQAIKDIYHADSLREKVVYYVQQNKGNRDDGLDIFHEGIIALDRNIREQKFRGESRLSLYLFATCRFLWMNQLRKNQKVSLEEDHTVMDEIQEETPELTLITQERQHALKNLLEQLGERCRKILEMWQLSYSMEEIAAAMGLSSEKMARKSKYRCQQALVELIKQDAQWRSNY